MNFDRTKVETCHDVWHYTDSAYRAAHQCPSCPECHCGTTHHDGGEEE